MPPTDGLVTTNDVDAKANKLMEARREVEDGGNNLTSPRIEELSEVPHDGAQLTTEVNIDGVKSRGDVSSKMDLLEDAPGQHGRVAEGRWRHHIRTELQQYIVCVIIVFYAVAGAGTATIPVADGDRPRAVSDRDGGDNDGGDGNVAYAYATYHERPVLGAVCQGNERCDTVRHRPSQLPRPRAGSLCPVRVR